MNEQVQLQRPIYHSGTMPFLLPRCQRGRWGVFEPEGVLPSLIATLRLRERIPESARFKGSHIRHTPSDIP